MTAPATVEDGPVITSADGSGLAAEPVGRRPARVRVVGAPPAALVFDGRGLPGLPQRLMPLDDLRAALIHDGTPRWARDAIWGEVVTRARRDGPHGCSPRSALALPGLRRRAGRLALGWHGETADLDAELLAGFLERLTTIDLDAPNICARLIDAGARAVRRARHSVRDNDAIRVRERGVRRRRGRGITRIGS